MRVVLAAFSTQTHPYPLHVLTFAVALIPIALLLALLALTIFFRRRVR